MKMRSALFNSHQLDKKGNQGSDANQVEFEEEVMRENEAILSALGNTVTRLKASAGGLRDEAEDHNRLIDTVSSAFSRASSGVNRSVQRIEGVMGRYGCWHTLLVSIVVFLALYALYHVLRWSR